MAKILLDLGQFKASGIYTLEFDASETIVLNTQTIRLVVGFSRKGPFNAPVYLPDSKTAKQVFGDIDTFLERRGSYFHRALYTCLQVGPIFGLNLMPLNNDSDRGDKVPYQSLSIATTEANGKKVFKLYSSFYNKERFWFPDESYFLGNVNSPGSINAGKLFNITNLGQTAVSMIVRKIKQPQFDITAREWFGAGNVPTYIDEWDFVSDYFIEMILVQGDWTNYKQLSIDPIFSKYFDTKGLIKAQVANFLNAPEVTTIGTFSGTIIPDFIDGNNVSYSIDTIVNAAIAQSGIFIAIDREALENYDLTQANSDDYDNLSAVDMIGHNFADPNRVNPDIINYLSYKTPIKEVLGFTYKNSFTLSPEVPTGLIGTLAWKTESLHLGRNYGYFNNVVCIPKPVTDNPDDLDLFKYTEYKNLLVPTESLIKLDNTEPFAGSMTGTWGKIEQVYEEVDTLGKTWLKLVWSHPNKQFEKPDEFVSGLKIASVDNTAGAMTITLNASDMTTEQQMFWLEPNGGLATTWPDVGEDILIENKDTKTWFYFKLKLDPVHTNATEAYYIEESGTPSVVGDYHHTDDIVTIYVDDSDAMDTLKRSLTGYKLYMASAANAQLEEGSIVGQDWVTSVSPAFVAEPDVFTYVPATGTPSATDPNYFVAYKYSKLFDYYENGALTPGDQVFYAEDDTVKTWYLDYDVVKDTDGISALVVKVYDTFINNQLGWYNTLPTGLTTYGYAIASSSITPRESTYNGDVFDMYVYGTSSTLSDSIQIVANSWNPYKTTFQTTVANAAYIEVGQYVVSLVKQPDGTETYKLTKIIAKKKVYSAITSGYVFEYTVNQPIYINSVGGSSYVVRYKPIDDFISNYQMFYLDGFKITDYHLPGGLHKQAQLEKILGVLDPANTNLMKVLKERNIITFRYIVDTFGGGLNANTYPKTYLTQLAKTRQKCMAIMNAPSISEFMISSDPRFTEQPTLVDPKPILNTRYIADGGNLTLGPSYTFSLPDEFNGAKFCGYFSPFLVLRENGKNILVPPAAHVSNLFVQKFINGTPYAIVAGTKRGALSDPKLVGLEYDFLLEDREYLEPFGFNPIIKKKGQGYIIYGNQMAYQKTRSAFNNLHVRDLLITIEEAIEDLLANYTFDFNNPSTRLEIKTRVETYLDGVRSNDGIYNYQVTMDDTNNTNATIDQQFGIIDVAIEPARGIQKFINRITVYKTGGISSGGFSISV